MNLTQKAILSTIAYYDTLDYPLTAFEVFKYLVSPIHILKLRGISPGVADFKAQEREEKISLAGITDNLDNSELKKYIEEENGFYFLKGREKTIRIRINRQKIADQKWKKARKIIRWLQIIPYLKMVAVSGSLALNNTKEESDFDLLIVVKHRRIWLTRFLITLLVQFMGKRRPAHRRGKHKNYTKDRICLNHYITDKSLGIKFKSLYNAQTYAHMIPVLEIEQGIYSKFQRANGWIQGYLNSYQKLKTKHLKTLKTNFLLLGIARLKEKGLNGKFGDFWERFLKTPQKNSIERDPLTYKKGGRVTIDDTQLEFHPDSPERRILDKYNQTMLYLGVGELTEQDSGLRR